MVADPLTLSRNSPRGEAPHVGALKTLGIEVEQEGDRVATSEPSFRRVRLGERKSELLIDLKDLSPYFSDIGPWSGIAPDSSELFVRNLSTDEIYLDLP